MLFVHGLPRSSNMADENIYYEKRSEAYGLPVSSVVTGFPQYRQEQL